MLKTQSYDCHGKKSVWHSSEHWEIRSVKTLHTTDKTLTVLLLLYIELYEPNHPQPNTF